MATGPSLYISSKLAEKALTDDEYNLRVEFVKVFMASRDAYSACLELGFLSTYARSWAKKFLSEGLVRRLIAEADGVSLDGVAAGLSPADARKCKYRAWLEKQATYTGPGASHGARVKAILGLVKIEGMDSPVKTQTEISHRGGVMVVPPLTTPDEWSISAEASQEKLKNAAVKES